MKKVRLYNSNNLNLNMEIIFDKNISHYLLDVLRLKTNDFVYLFNNGLEYKSQIINISKNICSSKIIELSDSTNKTLPICLALSLIKPTHFEWAIEKATELGIREIQPIITEFVNQPKMKMDRFSKIIIEASEQCGRNDIPKLLEPIKLENFLKTHKNKIYFADERRLDTTPINKTNTEFAILIGPEGGFSNTEFELLSKYKAQSINLGKTILRAETAAVVAIAKLS